MMDSVAALREAWVIQRRVIGALFLREVLTRFGRHNIGFLWLFVEPMLFTLGVTALWTATKSLHGSSLSIVTFAITGYSSVLLWRNMPARCIGALQPNLSLMFHRQVKAMDIYIARILLEASGATVSFVVLSIVFLSIGWIQMPEDLLKVVGGWLMLAWFGAALALLMGSLSEEYELVDKLWHPLSYLLFPMSGAAFLVDALPPPMQNIVLLLPMVHGIEYLRDGYFGSQFTAHHDIAYMTLVCLGLTLLGLAQLRKIGRAVVPE
ncbi:ABC transporter permease [Sphingomonas fennica]|uniref:Transport permease protein n=1 Tax=Edaphosphingomonas fennica TaxID=114404 RepID=A0A2T4HLR8_9SPHN|nr:ABC transporter permease [Sphingomonas fennica]PTD16751.1 sugar ABC transporter permease [Sphingomonas fennica]